MPVPVHPSRNPVAAVLFDLDGTLIDSAPDLHVAANRLLTERGLPALDISLIKQMIGDGARRLVDRALGGASSPMSGAGLDAATARFLEIYMEAPSTLTRPYDGVVETLGRLQQAGLRMGVCTNKPAKATNAILRDLGLAHFFSGVSGGDSAPMRKPDPGHVLDALRRMGSTPDRTVMVGDNEHDVHAGNAAGLRTVAITYGYARQPYPSLGADRLINRFSDLLPVLAELGVGDLAA